jgi:cell wall-associated NlpC family hydrolase
MVEELQVTAGVAAIRSEPAEDAPMLTQLLCGEVFGADTEREGWVKGVSRHDGYAGWVDASALSAPMLIPTHRVSAVRTYVFSEPDLKSAPRSLVSLNAKISAGRREGRFIEAQRLGWVFSGHLSALDAAEPDFVAVAERFVNSPYLWGGKQSQGLDCSGLIQVALEAAGARCPRDTGDQEAWAHERWGHVPLQADLSGLQRGDLVFWPGHVGVMTDTVNLLHANAHHMMTVIEPLSVAARRIEHNHAPIRAIYRAPSETSWNGLV